MNTFPESDSPTPPPGDASTESSEAEALRADLRRELDDVAGWLRGGSGATGDSPEAHDFVDWLLRAARLAACGDDEPFRTWPEIATTLGIDVTRAVADAAATGITVLDESAGIPLGEAVCDAEDASCLMMIEPSRTGLLDACMSRLGLWTSAAGEVPLDDLAFEVVEHRRSAWPVPVPARLPIVAAPLHEVDLLIAASAATPAVRLAPIFEAVEEMAQFDGGRPSPRMIERFEARRGRGVTPGGLSLEVRGTLDEWWGVFVRIEGAAVSTIRHVRLGTMPLQRNSESPEVWEVALGGMPLETILRLLNGDIAIRTADGGRFLV